MFNQLLSIILIVILVGSLVTQMEISLVSALVDPATGIKTSSKFGTLQIDHSEYDVTYVNSTIVKVNGTIANLNSIDTKMIIIFALPDGTTTGSQIAPNGDGTFQISLPLNSNSQKGTYSVSASYAQNTIGALTFTVKLVPVGIQSPSHLQTQAQNQIKTQNVTKTSTITTNLHTPIVINDNATGGNCWLVGRFDTASKTCTLLQDLPVGIIMTSNGITLDGNGHILDGGQQGGFVWSTDPICSGPTADCIKPDGHVNIGIHLDGITNTILQNFKIKNFHYGISSSNSNASIISNNVLDNNNDINIFLNDKSNGNTLNSNTISSGHGYGIVISGSNNVLTHNTINGTGAGVSFFLSSAGSPMFGMCCGSTNHAGSNTLQKSIISANNVGIDLVTASDSIGNTIMDNMIVNNNVGVRLQAYQVNKIYNNNFIDNQKDIDEGGTPILPLSLPLPVGGNYWSQFNTTTKGCNDLDYDNICDIHYTPLGNFPILTDYFPWNFQNGWRTKFISNENITATATSFSGNSIKYNISASLDNRSLQVNCSPSSGSVFSIGTTLVKCTAENGRKTSFGVSVIDTPPIVTPPPNLVVEADNFSGAVVSYSQPHAVDNIGVTNGPTCSPSSFSLFPPGINLVKCTASDGSGNIGSANFTITVKDTKQQMILECQKNLLSNVFPTTADGLTWSLHNEKDMTYLNNNKEVSGYEREYVKTDSFSSADLVVDIYQYDSKDEAKKVNDVKITSSQQSSPAGFSQLNGLGFPSECSGLKEDFGLQERVRLFCVKDNFRIYVGGLGSLLGLEDESTNFAKMTMNKIGSFEEQHSSLISQECTSKSSSFVSIPNWIRNNARGWHDNSISDNMFKQGIQYMIQQKIMSLPQTQSNTTVKSIPSWMKNNAGWWADEQISDDEFVKDLQYLIQIGIIKVS